MEPQVEWARLIGTLARVEDVADHEAGLLAFGTDSGSIFVERGRICWAAAHNKRQRLRDILRLLVDRDVDFDRIYERCRRQGSHLGQTLVDEGWVTPVELETALRRHSAESMIELCTHEAPEPTWNAREGGGYAPRFTFRPVDVLLDVVALHIPELQAEAQATLGVLSSPDRLCAAFCFDDSYEIAVPVAAFGALDVHALWNLGLWAMSIPLATRELGTQPMFTLSSTATGETTAVWWRGELLYAVRCPDRYNATRVVVGLDDEALP
ncbi:MAG TPA: hypothetical protein VGG28_22770 [Kofleriaceae bacterium]|jgi:hypothetical protein